MDLPRTFVVLTDEPDDPAPPPPRKVMLRLYGTVTYGSLACLPGMPDLRASAPDFWSAFVAWFRSDPVLAVAFPGGIVHTTAPPAAEYPFVRYAAVVPMDATSADDWPMHTTLSAYAQTKGRVSGDAEARSSLRLLGARLDVAPPIAFSFWKETAHRFNNQIDTTLVRTGNDGVTVYRADVDVEFWVRPNVTAYTGVGPW